jgi:hypothetical protein
MTGLMQTNLEAYGFGRETFLKNSYCGGQAHSAQLFYSGLLAP